MWMLTAVLICAAFPQLFIICLRLSSRWQLQSWKLIANQTFMLKTLANILLVKKLGRGSSIWKVSVSFFFELEKFEFWIFFCCRNWKFLISAPFKQYSNLIQNYPKPLIPNSNQPEFQARIWCCCFKPARKPRHVMDNCESIASISKYVH